MPSDRINQFYDLESFAVIGVSRSKKNLAWSILDQLQMNGKRVYAINPKEGTWEGVQFFNSLNDVPETVQGIIVCVDLKKSTGLIDMIKNYGAKYIWFQQGSYDQKILEQANGIGLDPIKGCAMMYMPGVPFFHRFHRAINDLFGKGYK